MSEKIQSTAATASFAAAAASAEKEQCTQAPGEDQPEKIKNASISGSFSGKGNVKDIPPIDRLQKKPTAHAILGAYGARYPTDHQDKARAQKPSWNMLTKLKTEIGNYIGQMAEDINTSVEMVKMVGCDHIEEFNVAVNATNNDFQNFIKDFNSVAKKHEGREGIIKNPNDLALSMQIFEDYNQFRAKFEGTMHHALINFTDYSLEARDRMVAAEQAKVAQAEGGVPAEEVDVISTETKKDAQ